MQQRQEAVEGMAGQLRGWVRYDWMTNTFFHFSTKLNKSDEEQICYDITYM